MGRKHKHHHKIKEKKIDDDEDELQQELEEEEREEKIRKKRAKKAAKKARKYEEPEEDEDLEANYADENDVRDEDIDEDDLRYNATSNKPKPSTLDKNSRENNWVEPNSTPMNQLEEGKQGPERRRSVAFNQMKYNNEGLGDDFELTPWVPPSMDLAKEYFQENVLKGGRARMWDVDMTKEQECGDGLALFFLFMKVYSWAFLIMALLSIPSLMMTTSGQNVPLADQDSLGLYKMTIGNIGYNKNDPNYASLSDCNDLTLVNSSCINWMGSRMTMKSAGEMISWFEFAQVIVFYLAFLYLRRQSYILTQSAAGRDCAVSDYAVWVTGIPNDTTIERLISHFSNLYHLNVPDWKNRPPLYGAQVVTDYSNTDIDVHYNTWIAEATIYKTIGSYIRAFKKEGVVIEQLKRSRAFMKMYKDDTCHLDGPNTRKYSKWEDKMLRLGGELDALTEQLMYHHKKSGNDNKGGPKRRKSIAEELEAEPYCAFIVFNYSESRARCLEDYQGYSRFPWNLCYPTQLKYRGMRIEVNPAPEPDEIIWENLEISPFKKFRARFCSSLISILFIVIGFAIILASAGVQSELNKNTPNLSLCDAEIPALYEQTYSGLSPTPQMVRPSTFTTPSRETLDAECAAMIPDSFYVYYSIDGNKANVFGSYDINACRTEITSADETLYQYNGPCPHYNQTVFCPCFSTSSTATCSTLGCSTDSKFDYCGTFEARSLSGCYCASSLTEFLPKLFTIPGVFYMWDRVQKTAGGEVPKSDVCTPFFKSYMYSKIATYGAAFAVTLINMFLKRFIASTTKREYYNTTDVEIGQIIKKVFLIVYVNLAIVVLLAYGYLKGGGSLSQQTNVLNGDHVDFTPAWYGQVGSYLLVSFVLNAFSPFAVNVPKYFILRPLTLCTTVPKVEKKKSHKIAMQEDCNKLLTGRKFDSTLMYAQLLALLFFGMTFSAGIPLFMPLLAITFMLYQFLNKYLLLRYYHKPGHMGAGANVIILNVLPYAGFIRLAFGIWMYGNNALIPSTIAQMANVPGYSSVNVQDAEAQYEQYLKDHQDDTTISFLIISKAVRANVLPLFILLGVVLGIKILKFIIDQLPIYYIYENLGYLIEGIARCCGKKENVYVSKVDEEGFVHATDLVKLKHPLRNEMAPFTDIYLKYIHPSHESLQGFARFLQNFKREFKLKPSDEAEGWAVVEQDDWLVKIKKWTNDLQTDKITIQKGTYKRTFEVVSDHGCFSYALDRIPDYQVAVKGLKDNITDYNYDQMGKEGRQDKFETQENIVERFLKEKHQKEHEKQEKLAREAAAFASKKKPEGKGGKATKDKIIPTNPYMHAKTALREDDDDDDEEEEDEEFDPPPRKNNRKNAKQRYDDDDDDDDEDDSDDDDFNRGVSGLV